MNNKKLLEGLGGDGISVSELASYTAKSGVNVSANIGRIRGNLTLPPKVVGIQPEKMTDESRAFFSTYIKLGTMNFIPREPYERNLSQIENRVRGICQRSCINGAYMPVSAYKEVKEVFEAARKDYFAERDLIVANWDNLIDTFRGGVKQLLDASGLLEDDKARLLKQVMSNVPSKTEYANSFYMKLQVQSFPVQGAVPAIGLEESIAKDINEVWSDDVVRNACKSIETLVGTAFAAINKAVRQYTESGGFHARSISAAKTLSHKLEVGNVFRNPLLRELSIKLAKVESAGLDDDIEDIFEDCLLDIHQYGKEAGLRLEMGLSPFDEKTLDQMLKNREDVQANMAAQIKMEG